MHRQMTTAFRARSVATMTCVMLACLLRAASAVSAENKPAPLDFEAVTAETEKLRSEQFSIGEKVLKDFPQNFESLRIMGFVYSGNGNREKMAQCWRQCVELEPDRADVHDQLGQYEFQNQAYETAIEHWERSLAIDSKYPGAHRQIGEALLQLGKPEDAKTYLHRAVEIAPDDSDAHVLLGEVQYQLRDLQQAKQHYARAAEIRPTLKQAYYGLIKTCRRLGERHDVARYSQKFQQLQSAIIEADRELRQRFDDLQKIRGEVAVTCLDAGRLYAGNKRLADAESLWKRACELDADNPTARQLLGTLYLGQRKVAEAIEQFEALARLEPKDSGHFERLGFLEARQGNLAAAERYFKQALVIAPKNATGYRSLAKFYLNTKRQAKQAHELAETAVKIEPVADSYFVLGWSLAVNGRRDEAAAALQKAAQMEPSNPTYRQLHEMVQQK